MRKKYTLIITIIILLSTIIALFILLNNKNNASNLETRTERKLAEESLQGENRNHNMQIILTSSIEEKTSPNTKLIFKTKYKACNHVTIEKGEIEEKLINKTEVEIANQYKDWKIESFSPNEIIFYKEKDGICNEHYILKEKDGYIAIYNIDEEGNENLEEITQIVTSYLPKEDEINLIEGIKVEGRQQLNATLEDYE